PIVMMSRPYFGTGTGQISDLEVDNCINVIKGACETAQAAGDKAVAFLSGKTDFFGTAYTGNHSDGIHPNNKGHEKIAATTKVTLEKLFAKS
ncbi:MAG: SGNH/GDSL hydrolase family protein, partial [Clostridia bacterium]|nr:SGNH/GDSL hydrolase family protein [Clostridia bacterium]